MSTISRTISAKVGSLSVNKTKTETVSSTPLLDDTLPVAKAGSLTTRTDATDGEITAVSSEHGITTGDIVDLYWSGGSRQGVVVGTVSGTAIPISGGSGDDLPAAETSINVAPTVTFRSPFDGDDVKAVIITSSQDATVDFRTAAASAWLVSATPTEPVLWFTGDSTNELAGESIETIRCSNASTSNVATLKISIGQDVTP